PGRLACAREAGALAEEAVAGVDCVAAGVARDRDDARAVEVGRRPGRTERDRLAGAQDVERARVLVGVDRDGRDPELGRGLRHPDGDLAAIGNEELLEHVDGGAWWHARRARRSQDSEN